MNQVQNFEIQIDEAESSGTYDKHILFDKKTYQKILSKSLKMDSHEGFKRGFLNLFRRTNIHFFGTHIMEQSIPGHLATEQVELSLITLDQIKRRIVNLPSKDRRSSPNPHSGQLTERIRHPYHSHVNA